MDEINGSEIVLAQDPNQYPGWRVIDVIYKEEAVQMSEQGYDDHGTYRNTTRAIVLRNPVFVMSRPAVEKIAELEKNWRIANADLKKAEAELNKALKNVSELDRKLEELRKLLAEREKYVQDMIKTNNTLEQEKQKLEADLGKIRTELGDARWREMVR